jgi:hypothetical protein
MGRRNQYLTEGMAQVLRIIDESDEKELAQSIPGGWWVGDQEVDGRVCMALLRFCLLHQEHDSSETFIRYTINEDGRGVMNDPTYVPKIVTAMKEKKL